MTRHWALLTERKVEFSDFEPSWKKAKLSDGGWVHLIGRLKKTPGIRVTCEATCRGVAQAVLWILGAGAQWRLLPDRLGHWNSVFKCFAS
ncbi:hypothetical protein [Polaromonas sp. CG9_12]|nr:hypothetical protein [Polaromonas sp. CG9_12]